MQAIKFTLSGEFACFRRPDVNEKVYFTYNNIHKVALMGLLGAIIGLKGYGASKKDDIAYPEFYETLHKMKVAIVPNAANGYFTKKIQYFNNSAGYASSEAGRNLQVREQWLEKPSWQILLMQKDLEDPIWMRLTSSLSTGEAVYLPYLGKNDFPAEISDVNTVQLVTTNVTRCHSIVPLDIELKALRGLGGRYFFVETAPIGLVEEHHFYTYKTFVFTDGQLPESCQQDPFFTDGERCYSFF